MKNKTRRDFLRTALQSATALGAMSTFGRINALASGGSGYQALVCIFLAGGNDGHNTVVPITTVQQNYSLYQKGRQSLALPQNSLRTIMNGSDTYGLHANLPELQALYTQGRAAVLANVGNLVVPLSQGDYQTAIKASTSAALPSALFSHSDQSSQWQSGAPNGTSSTGWGGRIMDLMQSQNGSAVFPSIANTGGCGLFCAGQQTFPATVPPPSAGSQSPTGMAKLNSSGAAGATAQQQLLGFQSGLQLVQAADDILNRGNQYANTLSSLLSTSNVSTPFPANNPLAAQLRTVANIMSVRGSLGLTRQIFFCQLGSFDTHGDQTETQQQLLAQLSQAVSAFYQATVELGLAQNVTTFTASEFGRTLSPSGTDGTDHAWGNHHFIVGGAVQGGKFYGSFPSLVLGGAQDANMRGTLIPTTSVAQYGATLARWFGVSASDMATVFPNIGGFTTSNLGFLG